MNPIHNQPANEILPNLWLGNIKASQDETFIRAKGINVVFNCTKDIPFSRHIETKYRLPVDDNLEEQEIRNLALWSNEIVYKIAKHYRAGDHILIHCMAGMQRSAACMAMFLILKGEIHTADAIHYIRAKRPIAFNPSANFLKSIEYFDNLFHGNILPRVHNKEVTVNTL